MTLQKHDALTSISAHQNKKQETVSVGDNALSYGEILQTLHYEKNKIISKKHFYEFFQYTNQIENLGKYLNYQFKDRENLFESLTHSSVSHEFKGLQLSHNEKLEFLGDSVLNTIVSKEMYCRFKDLNEGQFSKLRSALVNEDILTELALAIKLDQFLLLGKGERESFYSKNSAILCDGFEAILAAIFLESGFDQTTQVFQSIIDCYEKNSGNDYYSLHRLMDHDPKSTLQEKIVELTGMFPKFESREVNPSLFELKITLDGQTLGSLVYTSKKKGFKKLAKQILTEKSYIKN